MSGRYPLRQITKWSGIGRWHSAHCRKRSAAPIQNQYNVAMPVAFAAFEQIFTNVKRPCVADFANSCVPAPIPCPDLHRELIVMPITDSICGTFCCTAFARLWVEIII